MPKLHITQRKYNLYTSPNCKKKSQFCLKYSGTFLLSIETPVNRRQVNKILTKYA